MTKDVAALKAVSQNLMHQDLSVTDGVYGILSEQDTRKQISALVINEPDQEAASSAELSVLLRQVLERLEKAHG